MTDFRLSATTRAKLFILIKERKRKYEARDKNTLLGISEQKRKGFPDRRVEKSDTPDNRD